MGAPVSTPKNTLDILNTKPPPDYVAGLGRGAIDFTTRSSALAAPNLPDRSATIVGGAGLSGVGRGRGKGPGKEEEEDETKEKRYYVKINIQRF
jgi:pre-mRNA-processing factor 6